MRKFSTQAVFLLLFQIADAQNCDPAYHIFDEDISVNGDISTCANSTCIYSTPFSNEYSYSWTVTGGQITQQNNNSVLVHWNGSGSGIVQLSVRNMYGCDSSVSASVIIHSVSSPFIIGNATLCSNRPARFIVAGALNTDQISWNVTAGNFLTSNTDDTVSILFTESGNEMISVTLTNQNGCDSTVNFPVTLLDGPAPSITGPSTVCINDISVYSVPSKPGHTYIWSVIGGSVISFEIDNDIEVQWSTAGQGLIACRQTSPDGCDSVISLNVSVNQMMAPVISGPTKICQNDQEIFYAGLNAGSIYHWTINGIPSSQNGSLLQQFWNSPGRSTIVLNEINSNGCQLSDSISVDVYPKPIAFINGSSRACINEGLQKYYISKQSNINYHWSIDTGGALMSSINSDTLKVLWSIPGLHFVTLNASDPITGCDSTFVLAVNADTLQKPALSSNIAGCAPFNLNVTGNNENPSYHYSWEFGDSSFSFLPNPTHTYLNSGEYSLRVIYENAIGCKDSFRSNVSVMLTAEADFSIIDPKDYYLAEVENIQVVNKSIGADRYIWKLGEEVISNQFQPGIVYKRPGNYFLELIANNSNGCIDSTYLPVEIRVPEDVYIPNSFTPNGDDVNDYFSITFLNINEVSVSIFNRSGVEIFSSKDTRFKWDGTYKGQPVQPELYVYVIDATGYYGTEIRKVGKVSLIR